MDPLIANDTQATHWVLDNTQMEGFIKAFFSDDRIFNDDVFPLPKSSSMVLSILQSLPPSLYANDCFPMATKTRVMETDMAKFFNQVVCHAIGLQRDIHPAYKHR